MTLPPRTVIRRCNALVWSSGALFYLAGWLVQHGGAPWDAIPAVTGFLLIACAARVWVQAPDRT